MKFLFDPGHGGLAFGHYLTPGKRSPKIPPGIFEGDYNRMICRLVEDYVDPNDPFEAQTIVPGPINVPLVNRVKFVNQVARLEKVALISIHCNAIGNGARWRDAEGFVVFHSRMASPESKLLAKYMHNIYAEKTPFKSRGIREANFKLIYGYTERGKFIPIACPAILLELGFMTNFDDIELLTDPDVQDKIVLAIYQTMAEFTGFTK